MNLPELRAKLDELEARAGTDEVLVRVLTPGSYTYPYLSIEDLVLVNYHDPGEISRVIYIQMGETP